MSCIERLLPTPRRHRRETHGAAACSGVQSRHCRHCRKVLEYRRWQPSGAEGNNAYVSAHRLCGTDDKRAISLPISLGSPLNERRRRQACRPFWRCIFCSSGSPGSSRCESPSPGRSCNKLRPRGTLPRLSLGCVNVPASARQAGKTPIDQGYGADAKSRRLGASVEADLSRQDRSDATTEPNRAAPDRDG